MNRLGIGMLVNLEHIPSPGDGSRTGAVGVREDFLK